MCVASAATTVIQWIAVRHPELQAEEVRGTMTIHRAVASSLTLFLVLAIVVIFPDIGLWALLLLFPGGIIGDRLAQRSRTAHN